MSNYGDTLTALAVESLVAPTCFFRNQPDTTILAHHYHAQLLGQQLVLLRMIRRISAVTMLDLDCNAAT